MKKEATIYDVDRLCRNQESCAECPIGAERCKGIGTGKLTVDKVNEITLKWCEEHPRKTRQSELLKAYPKIWIGENGVIDLCPQQFGLVSSEDCRERICTECRKDIWMEEIE